MFPILCFGQSELYENYNRCNCSIDIPTEMTLNVYESTFDYCDAEIILKNGQRVIELHSLNISKFEFDNIEDLFNAAVIKHSKNPNFKLTYKMKKINYFVISGVDNKSGNIIYWKRVVGDNFISDLRFDYPFSLKKEVEPFIGKIAKSFESY